MKLSEYATKYGLTYKTAYNHWIKGYLAGTQLPSGTIIIQDYDEIAELDSKTKNVILYARVSSSENKSILNSQLNRLRDYSVAKGYTIIKEVKEIGSGLNDRRKKLENILFMDDYDLIIVEHKDRLARFGINYIQLLLNKLNKDIEIINKVETDDADLMQDFVSIITSFVARLYGLRRSGRKTEEIITKLQQ